MKKTSEKLGKEDYVISSRNRNKNRNKSLQIKAKEREKSKKAKLMENLGIDDSDEVKVFSPDLLTREKIVVVPERKSIDKSDFDDDFGFVTINMDRTSFTTDDENSSDKFNFVDSTEEIESHEIEVLEEFDGNESEFIPVEDFVDEENIEVRTISEEELIPPTTDHVDVNARKYISFESRIVGLLVIIIVSFFVAGLFIFKSITYTSSDAITYDEKSFVEYKVCLDKTNSNQYYSNSCLNENMEYLSAITNNIPLTFKYDMSFDKDVTAQLNYFVVSKVNIYSEKAGKILNTTEDVLVERTSYNVFGNENEVSIDIVLPYKKYYNYVNNYNTSYGLESYAELEVAFYVDNGNTIKNVSSLTMPISTKTFNIKKMVVENEKQKLTVSDDEWGSVNSSYAVVGLVFVLFGLLAIIRLSNLVYKITATGSMYQKRLQRILREYDKMIVISRGDYNVDLSKRLIKVPTFSELLDARNALEKPIVYVKVNNVKSEFYVEDSEAVYKYTMKEADFEGK